MNIIKILVRVFLISVAISLLMIQGAIAQTYQHVTTGIIFPANIATLEKGEVYDYEKDNPGLGVSVGYNSPGIAVTIYLYTMGMKTVPVELQSSTMKAQFKQAAGDIMHVGEKGWYSNVKEISEGEVAWGDAPTDMRSLHASYSYSQKGTDRISHLYLLSFKNHFLKIRFTYEMKKQKAAEKLQKEFLKDFGIILRAA